MNETTSLEPANGCERLLSRSEVAALLRVTPRSITNWSRQGLLPAVRLPGRKQTLGYLPSAISKLITTPKA